MCSLDSDPTLGSVVDKTFLDFEQKTDGQRQCFLGFWFLWFFKIFVKIAKSSISLKLLYNPPYYLSIWGFSNCKMTMMSSLGLYGRFGLKVEFHQFPFFLDCYQHLPWIDFKLHQKKFLTYSFHIWKHCIKIKFSI